ncbi:MAG: nucleotidyltransferase family protein [Geminicoccaceae bacterium]|nr:nucleotidyltransferase family protein [Geminicoccaceae bacterium]
MLSEPVAAAGRPRGEVTLPEALPEVLPDALIAALRDPEATRRFDARTWDRTLRQARVAGVTGALALRIEALHPAPALPPAVRRALVSARTLGAKIERDTRCELAVLRPLLAGLGVPVVLLKGAAYVARGLPAARGRIFGDIDLLVPRDALEPVERVLLDAGWAYGPIAAYDAAYYRRWTHELPPLEHPLRGTLIDVHHAIVQERTPSPAARSQMIGEAVPLDAPFAVLQPADMVLHAAVHLFNDGEFDRALRDLLDVDSLVRTFRAEDAGFDRALAARASAMGLAGQVADALHFARYLLGLDPGSDGIAGFVEQHRTRGLVERCFVQGFRPDHETARSFGKTPAHRLLYLRGHYLRMPLLPLSLHLLRKALTGGLHAKGASGP